MTRHPGEQDARVRENKRELAIETATAGLTDAAKTFHKAQRALRAAHRANRTDDQLAADVENARRVFSRKLNETILRLAEVAGSVL